jgi:hypothetical protein
MDKVSLKDIFGPSFEDVDCTEKSRSEKLKYLRRLEEELIDLRKEVFALRKELHDDNLR